MRKVESAKVALVGLGPHAKRIYMKCFKLNAMEPALIIDLESKRKDIEDYVKENNITSELLFIPEYERNARALNEAVQAMLIEQIKKLGITHAIISTEPKAHYEYICFFLENNINILVDKPLTAPENVCTDSNMAKKVYEDYDEIKRLYQRAHKNGIVFQIQCQRRWHKGYRFVHELATETVKKYNIPITSIQMTHCDGMWNMPKEFVTRENHPYKYGYGKLFHSGYHFVDLVSWFASINDNLKSKKADNVELYAASVGPKDFLNMINKDDYFNLFHDNKQDIIFDNASQYSFDKYGELDLYSIMQFKQKDNVILTATLSLMQNGFSRRAWDELPVDTYKGNGRVRHEYMNIEIGPLMNIQIHSYQSKEIKDRIAGKHDIGEVEHFDIYVFRNVELIGGQPMEKYTLDDLYQNEKVSIGYNENAREMCFDEFIHCNIKNEPIYEHELGIKILSKEYEALCKKYHGEDACVRFSI